MNIYSLLFNSILTFSGPFNSLTIQGPVKYGSRFPLVEELLANFWSHFVAMYHNKLTYVWLLLPQCLTALNLSILVASLVVLSCSCVDLSMWDITRSRGGGLKEFYMERGRLLHFLFCMGTRVAVNGSPSPPPIYQATKHTTYLVWIRLMSPSPYGDMVLFGS